MRAIIRSYRDYLQTERGLAPTTVAYYVQYAESFLAQRFRRLPIFPRQIRADDVARFVLRHARDHSPGRAKLMVTALRALFRFLLHRGRITRDLAGCVPTVADWRLATLPKSLRPEEVEQVLAGCDRRLPAGHRDFAILSLLARLGLRASEILELDLEDLHWEAGEITVRGKGYSNHRLPILRDVGRALVAYLRNSRPRNNAERKVFLGAYPPFGRLTKPSTVSSIARRAILRAGLRPPRKGAHLFRHSLACRMLNEGSTLSEIGEILRHRHPDTTAIYAKVDTDRLRSLALPWPGGRP